MSSIKLFSLTLFGVVIASATSSAAAAISVPYGWYAEANVGESSAQGKSYPGNDISAKGFGWNANGGYKFSPFFETEVGFTRYATTYIKNRFGTNTAKDQHYSYDVAGKVLLPVGTTGAEFFGKLGVARINSNVTVMNAGAAALNGMVFNTGTHTSTAPYFGAGADYAVLTSLFLNAQWMRANGNNKTGTLDLYSIGVSYIF